MADTPGKETELPLSEKEKRILELYDRLLRLEFELALTKARQEATIGTPLVWVALQVCQYLTDRALRHVSPSFPRGYQRSPGQAPGGKGFVDAAQRCCGECNDGQSYHQGSAQGNGCFSDRTVRGKTG